MRVNIYYGGRGLIEDPTLYVIQKLTEVLEELRVEVIKYNLYEDKKGINILPKTLKEADGVILATTVEWLGIGGLMQQFLDACWLYGDKEKLSRIYMLPVVMASTYGERDAECMLIKAWEMLGGIPCEGLCAYVEDHIEFETNPNYALLIEKKAEMLYRHISHKMQRWPSSSNAVKQSVLRSNSLDLTPQESEQLSIYVSNDSYVKKQKEDIEELSQLFKGMLGEEISETPQEEKEEMAEQEVIIPVEKAATAKVAALSQERLKPSKQPEEKKRSKIDQEQELILEKLKIHFQPQSGFMATYAIFLEDINKTLIVAIKGSQMECYFGEIKGADVQAKTTKAVLHEIVTGKMTLQRAFMSGELTAKGDFKTLRTFDTLFRFV